MSHGVTHENVGGVFAVYQRGAWFSAGSHLKLIDLQLNQSFTIMLWVKPFNFLSFFSAEGDLMLLTSDYKDEARKLV